MRQPLSFRFAACAPLKLSSAQNSGSHRSLSGPASAAWCAEFTTSTAWNLKPTLGRGCTFRTPASRSPASTSRYDRPFLMRAATSSSSFSRGVSSMAARAARSQVRARRGSGRPWHRRPTRPAGRRGTSSRRARPTTGGTRRRSGEVDMEKTPRGEGRPPAIVPQRQPVLREELKPGRGASPA